MAKKISIFATQFEIFTANSRFKDNIPSRLAAMQHTWGVFSFTIPTILFHPNQ